MEKYIKGLHKGGIRNTPLYILGLVSGITSVLLAAVIDALQLPGGVGMMNFSSVLPGPVFGTFLYVYLVSSGVFPRTKNSVLRFFKSALFIVIATIVYALVVHLVWMMSTQALGILSGILFVPGVFLASFIGAYLMIALLSLYGKKVTDRTFAPVFLVSVVCGAVVLFLFGVDIPGWDSSGRDISYALMVVIWQMSMFPLFAGQKTPVQATESKPSYGDWLKDIEGDGK